MKDSRESVGLFEAWYFWGCRAVRMSNDGEKSEQARIPYESTEKNFRHIDEWSTGKQVGPMYEAPWGRTPAYLGNQAASSRLHAWRTRNLTNPPYFLDPKMTVGGVNQHGRPTMVSACPSTRWSTHSFVSYLSLYYIDSSATYTHATFLIEQFSNKKRAKSWTTLQYSRTCTRLWVPALVPCRCR